jgi:RNA polymerase sigma-70 factor (ECF subfamily)
VVLRARDIAAPEARAALATLCQIYWYPIYAYVRRRGASADEAEDSTQEFFTRFLEKGFGGDVEQAKGKFRAYLLACCQHFLANQRRHARAGKRCGGRAILSLDVEAANRHYLREPTDTLDAERLFDRRWALTLLEQSLDQLGQEYEQQDKRPLFAELKNYLVGDSGRQSYAAVAERLGMTEGAVKKAAQRLRHRYGTVVRERIRATVDRPEQVEDEVRELFAVLAG